MHYEINVSHKGRHLFATHPRSLTHKVEADALFEEFQKLFPADDGYTVRMYRCERSAQLVSVKAGVDATGEAYNG